MPTEYVYDGRGSVAAEVSYNNAWYTLGGILSSKEVISKSYTPFGEQIGEASSGFGYNGEYYNAATGMVYLRARFYEPEMNRFSQKDVVRGSIIQPGSLNRYSYVQNDPVNFIDPSGQSLKSAWNSLKSAAQNAVTSVKNTVSKVTTAVKNVFTGGSSSGSNTAAPSKPAASSSGSKSSATSYNTARSSTTSSAVARSSQSSGSGGAYVPGPIKSTAQNFNPNNIMQSTSQAIADARKAADYMNATAPGSPAARQATQAYQETVRLASMANSSNNPNIARQAYDTSQFAVNRANNVATGRLPNAYMPYDSNGNATSYYNSSRQAGKAPSPGAPRVEDVSGDATYYCDREDKDSFVNSAITTFKTSIKTYFSAEIFEVTSKLLLLRDLGKMLVGEGTLFVGGTASAQAGARASVATGVIVDLNGNIAIIGSVGAGAGTPSAAAGISVSATNVPNVDVYLDATSFQVGGSVLAFGGDILILQDNESGNLYGGLSGSISPASTNIAAELHTEVIQYTGLLDKYNVFELLMELNSIIQRW